MTRPAKLLVPVSRSADAARIAVPSRVFPWVGFGFCCCYLVLTALTFIAAAGAVDPAAATSMAGLLWTVAVLLLVMLAWAVVHASRIGMLRYRLAHSLDGIVPPPPGFVAGVVNDDVAFYQRDERLGVIRFLTGVQAWTGRILDWAAAILFPSVEALSTSGPIDGDGSMFSAAGRPRTALMASVVWLSVWTVVFDGLALIGSGANGQLGLWPAAAWAALVLGALVLAALWTIAGLRLSLDRRLRRRAARLDRAARGVPPDGPAAHAGAPRRSA